MAVALCALLAAANLLQGLGGGLARLGWVGVGPGAVSLHGAVMVCGFFGTLISLERAVALRHALGYAVPLLAGLGGAAAWGAGAVSLALGLWALASGGLVGLYLWAGHTRAWSLHLGVEALGATCWGLGVAAWALGDPEAALRAWMAFLVLTIAGERRELMQMRRLPQAVRVGFVVVVSGALTAVLLGLAETMAGTGGRTIASALWWTACAALAVWLLCWDFAPRQWTAAQWPGHTAQSLSIGYVWLGIAALLGLAGLAGVPTATQAAGHALWLGFVFAMVFGHAPIILPALARWRPAYVPWARWAIVLLSASLVLRIVGLMAGHASALAWAGAGHALAIVWFALAMLTGLWTGRKT
jgi:hypothetical protein